MDRCKRGLEMAEVGSAPALSRHQASDGCGAGGGVSDRYCSVLHNSEIRVSASPRRTPVGVRRETDCPRLVLFPLQERTNKET